MKTSTRIKRSLRYAGFASILAASLHIGSVISKSSAPLLEGTSYNSNTLGRVSGSSAAAPESWVQIPTFDASRDAFIQELSEGGSMVMPAMPESPLPQFEVLE